MHAQLDTRMLCDFNTFITKNKHSKIAYARFPIAWNSSKLPLSWPQCVFIKNVFVRFRVTKILFYTMAQ